MYNMYYLLKSGRAMEGKRKRSRARHGFENGSLRDDRVFSLDNFEEVVTVCLRRVSRKLSGTNKLFHVRPRQFYLSSQTKNYNS